jgi:hypothetical protein
VHNLLLPASGRAIRTAVIGVDGTEFAVTVIALNLTQSVSPGSQIF